MRSVLLDFVLYISWGGSAHALSWVRLEELLPDPVERARVAVDQGNLAVVLASDCDPELNHAILSPDWVSGVMSLNEECSLEDEGGSGRRDEVMAAVVAYNRAVEDRAYQLGMFSPYPSILKTLDHEGDEELHGWYAKAPLMLQSLMGEVPFEIVEFTVGGVSQQFPSRMVIVAESGLDGVLERLDSSVWKKTPYPWDVLQVMHWYPGGDDAILLGRIEGYPAYFLIRKHERTAILIIALALGPPAFSP